MTSSPSRSRACTGASISERDGKTELRVTHVGLVPEFECFDACSRGWSFYIGESLRDLLTTGTGQPAEFPDELQAKAAAGH